MNTKIIGAGSSIPNLIIKNEDFLQQEFFDEKGRLIPNPESIVSKFKKSRASRNVATQNRLM